ncbi:MAG: hypothetical protein J6Y77_02650, partial [Paludibacteraceae bacterium]|nr:hypothetical protein [Paludibacteraceae bacterium]
ANITNNTHCTAPYDGQYEITATGGSGSGYTYSNDGTNFSATNIYNGLQSATATVYVKDGNECVSAGFDVTVNDNPVALTVFNVTGGGQYCEGTTAPLVGLDGSESGVDYTLYVGTTELGSLAGSGAALDFGAQAADGTYTVKALNSNTGCEADMAASATVKQNSLPTATISDGDKICTGDDLILTAGGGTSFNWNGAGYTTEATYSVPNTTAGTQNITLTVKDDNQCESPEITRDVVVTAMPQFLNGQAGVCSLDKLSYTAEIDVNVTVDGVLYVLDTQDGTSDITGNAIQVSAVKDQDVTLKVTSTENASCFATIVIPAPDCSCGVIANPVLTGSSYCEGDAVSGVSASANLETNEVVEWYDAATGGNLLGTGASYQPAAEGIFYAQVTNTVDNCHSERVSATVTENSLPVVTVASSSTELTCDEPVVTLTATATNCSFVWDDAAASTGATVDVDAVGTYTVTVTDLTTGCKAQAQSEAITENKPQLEISLSTDAIEDLRLGATATLEVAVLNGAYNQMIWQRNGEVFTPADELLVSEKPYGQVTYQVTAEGSCNTVSAEVTVQVIWPTVFTPYDGNGKNTTFVQGLDQPIPMIVYDRFGNKMAETSDGWDGVASAYSKKMATPGVYYYVAKLPDGTTRRGTVEVYR